MAPESLVRDTPMSSFLGLGWSGLAAPDFESGYHIGLLALLPAPPTPARL